MKLSLNWINDFVDLSDQEPQQVSEILTNTGLEVEGLEFYSSVEGNLQGLVVGEVISCKKHPNADKLSCTEVKISQEEIFPVVCGAPNVAVGQKVILAKVGATLYPSSSDRFTIKKAKIRGELSEGMICAEDEIGLSENHDGILVLPEDTQVGIQASEVLGIYTDWIFDIGLTPNRSDAISHFGAARDIAAFLKRDLKDLPKDIRSDHSDKPISINIDRAEDCPRYSGICIELSELPASEAAISNRLMAVGSKPINLIVDLTNYVMLEYGHPLHAFDLDSVKGDQINIKGCSAEKMLFLDDVERKTRKDDLGIYNGSELMALAGVMGGKNDSVTKSTRRIFLESAYFNPVKVRKTSAHHGLKTDAAFRFERGADYSFTLKAVERFWQLLKRYNQKAGICSAVYDERALEMVPAEISFNLSALYKLAGAKIDKAEVEDILLRLNFKIIETQNDTWLLQVPMNRVDVLRPADVIEEILRIFGYNKIPIGNSISYERGHPHRDAKYDKRKKVVSWLSAKGLNQIMTMTLQAENAVDSKKNVKVLSPQSEDMTYIRTNLLHGGLNCLAFNLNRQSKNLGFFEFGNVMSFEDGRYEQEYQLSIMLTGDLYSKDWENATEASSFHRLKGLVHDLLVKSGLSGIVFSQVENSMLNPTYAFRQGKNILATFGPVSKRELSKYKIDQVVWNATLHWELIESLKTRRIKIDELPKYPFVERDLALLMPENISYAEVETIIRKGAGKLLKKLTAFDLYRGKGVPENHKSMAVSLIFQDQNKTLNDKSIEKIIGGILKTLESELGVELR